MQWRFDEFGTRSNSGEAELAETSGRLSLRFRHLVPATVNYQVKASGELASWSPVATLPSGAAEWTLAAGASASSEDAGAGRRMVTITDAPAGEPSARRFLRLEVTPPRGPLE